jgi:predicted DNA-binding transcriptional regulator AlpA
MEPDQLLSRAAVAERVGVAVRTIERWARDGIGPKPIKLGPRVIRYRASDIEEWLKRDGG